MPSVLAVSPSIYSSAELLTPVNSQTATLLLAPDFVGGILGWSLYGLLTSQCYQYRLARLRDPDPLGIRLTVWGMFILETALAVVTTRVGYSLLCAGWGDRDALLRLRKIDAFIPVLSGLVSCLAQSFYAYRILVLSNYSRPWTIIAAMVVMLMTISTIAAIYAGFGTINYTDLSRLQDIKAVLYVWLLSALLCDVIIASAMVCLLSRMRALVRVENRYDNPLEKKLNSIIFLSVETCILTTLSTIIMLLFFVTLPDTRLPTMMGFISSRLYSNSLLASLNSRREHLNGFIGTDRGSLSARLETFNVASRLSNTSSLQVTDLTVL